MDMLPIKHAIAKAIFTNSALQAACQSLFGASMTVWCDNVGTNREAEMPDAREVPTPYCVVSIDGESLGGMDQQEEKGTIDVEICIDASQTAAGTVDASKRVQSADGYFKSASDGALETITAAVRAIAAANGRGAIVNGHRTDFDGKLYYPLQFANVYVEFMELREG